MSLTAAAVAWWRRGPPTCRQSFSGSVWRWWLYGALNDKTPYKPSCLSQWWSCASSGGMLPANVRTDGLILVCCTQTRNCDSLTDPHLTILLDYTQIKLKAKLATNSQLVLLLKVISCLHQLNCYRIKYLQQSEPHRRMNLIE